jgi:hypothetical protein
MRAQSTSALLLRFTLIAACTLAGAAWLPGTLVMKLLFLVAGLLFSGCANLQTTPALQQEVRLEVSVSKAGGDPVATIKAANTGLQPVAITKTFGFSNLFLFFDIEGRSGGKIEYPVNSQFELFSEPAYTCLSPGETMLLEINLRRWYHVLGGSIDRTQAVPEAGPYSFNLPSGEYRLKAVYDSPPSREKSHRCPRLNRSVESDWVDFAIP